MTNVLELNLRDKVVVVTGAASGIGRAVARHAERDGAIVAALDIRDDPNAPLTHGNSHYIHCDVSDPESWNSACEKLLQLGRPDYVHLNAGIQIAPPEAPMEEYRFGAMRLDRYRKMMGVNVDGVVFGLQTLLPHVNAGGAVVVTSSLAGVTPYGVDPLYAMSKHAVSGLVRSLAGELAEQDVRINAICPGGIDTSIIPLEQRTDDAIFMTPDHIADEVFNLMAVRETGKTWAKLADSKAAYIIRAPGDKGGRVDTGQGPS